MIDRRLLGTWKSDRRKTFKEYVWRPDITPARLKRMKALYGNLIIRYGYRRVYVQWKGVTLSNGMRLEASDYMEDYRVVAKDSDSVVIQFTDGVTKELRLRQLHFEGNHYWIWVGGNLREYFKRSSQPHVTGNLSP